MKKNKIAFTLFFYFFGNTFFGLITEKFLDESSVSIYSAALLIMQLALIIPLYILNKKELHEMIKDFQKNYKQYLKSGFVIWIIGFIIMISMTYLINYVIAENIALSTNEQIIRENIKKYFIYSFLANCFILPIVEELVFRQGFNQIKKTSVFLITTSSLFAFLHIIADLNNPIKILYFFPYLTLGLIFGITYRKTNNYFTSLIIHSWHNIFNFILIFIF